MLVNQIMVHDSRAWHLRVSEFLIGYIRLWIHTDKQTRTQIVMTSAVCQSTGGRLTGDEQGTGGYIEHFSIRKVPRLRAGDAAGHDAPGRLQADCE